MTPRHVRRVPAREGYDRWSSHYDTTANPLIELDHRYTLARLAPRENERILDAGCGTGRHTAAMIDAGARITGIDFSHAMLREARRKLGRVALAAADVHGAVPFRSASFDAVLCALVGEHLAPLAPVFAEFHRVLKPAGRLVFSVYHPTLAEAGSEANFEQDGTEFRLGAELHTLDDYEVAMRRARFRLTAVETFDGDEALAEKIPAARKYVGRPLLVVFTAS